MKRMITIISLLSVVGLTGCESLRTAVSSREAQGMVLGALIGAGTLAAIGSGADHHRGLGMWIGVGGTLGGLAGWYLAHPRAAEQSGTSSQP